MRYLFLLICLTGCNKKMQDRMFQSEITKTHRMEYYKDTRTNLCFAENCVYSSVVGNTVFVNVPCTPEVERLIEK